MLGRALYVVSSTIIQSEITIGNSLHSERTIHLGSAHLTVHILRAVPDIVHEFIYHSMASLYVQLCTNDNIGSTASTLVYTESYLSHLVLFNTLLVLQLFLACLNSLILFFLPSLGRFGADQCHWTHLRSILQVILGICIGIV